jgi:hypothetical protein
MARKKNTPAPLVMVENALPALRRAVRAVAIAAGKDETRKSYLRVWVQWNTPIGVMITATDGHRLHTATVHVGSGCGFDLLSAPPVCCYSPKGLLLAVASGEGALHVDAMGTLKVTVEGVRTSAPNVRSEGLPVWNQVIPTYQRNETLVVGLSPRYLAEAAEAAKAAEAAPHPPPTARPPPGPPLWPPAGPPPGGPSPAGPATAPSPPPRGA